MPTQRSAPWLLSLPAGISASGAAGAAILTIFAVVALLGALGWLPDHQVLLGAGDEPPSASWARCLGTDRIGRSVFFRLLAGAQTAMGLGLLTLATALPLGTALGLLAGYFGGSTDALVRLFYQTTVSVPAFLLVGAVSWAMGHGILAMSVALGITGWTGTMLLVRAQTQSLRHAPFVLAARAYGAGRWRILRTSLLPNVAHLALITAVNLMASAIQVEALLTYLGMGLKDGASWGLMLGDAQRQILGDNWWPFVATSATMFVLITGLHWLGDDLRRLHDPSLIHGGTHRRQLTPDRY